MRNATATAVNFEPPYCKPQRKLCEGINTGRGGVVVAIAFLTRLARRSRVQIPSPPHVLDYTVDTINVSYHY